MSEKTPWFSNWFDSEFYHILYSDRNHDEADSFVKKLVDFFKISTENSILDLGCGKGRHSFSLAQYSNAIMGVDLSSNSIKYAQNHTKGNNPVFEVADMRQFDLNRTFDYVLNLFTSFGYFDTLSENESVLSCISRHQNSQGILLIDYLNSEKVRLQGESKTIKTIQNIDFYLHKYLSKNHVNKKIHFVYQEKKYEFEERVQLFQKEELEAMILHAGYEILQVYGNYDMKTFNMDSDRMIIVSRKK
jgi:ubiquinone/menaquinone biosynthesis C-methylase UbiE